MKIQRSSTSAVVPLPLPNTSANNANNNTVQIQGEPGANQTQVQAEVVAYMQDTRTHVVSELYDTERSYVESLQIIIEVSINLDAMGRFVLQKCSCLLVWWPFQIDRSLESP